MKQLSSASHLLILALTVLFANEIQTQQEPACEPNSSFGCKRTCYEHCEMIGIVPQYCTKECIPACECNVGYIFKSESIRECVPNSECQVTCPSNMQYNPCTPNNPEKPGEGCNPRCVLPTPPPTTTTTVI